MGLDGKTYAKTGRNENVIRKIEAPTVLRAAGDPPKEIQEFVGRVNTGTEEVSVARMVSPPGWSEPGQTPAFNEYTVVLKGTLVMETKEGSVRIDAGQSVIVEAGTWVRYATPEGAEYFAVCLPAFSPQHVHRDRAEKH